MPGYLQTKLEFSPDPLTDTTPSWVDVTRWLVSAEWQDGKQREFDDPQAGTAAFVLRNDNQSGANRRFEPDYAAGAYYPNIVPRRRFRLTTTADGVAVQQGVWYATAWTPNYLAQTAISQVTVSCVDGAGLMALDPLGPLDPPDAADYPSVVAFDQPYLYCRLAETTGTKMSADIGAQGTYSGFGRGGIRGRAGNPLVTGDPTTSLQFTGSRQGASPLDKTNHFADTNQITAEALIEVVHVGAAGFNILQGPFSTTVGGPTFILSVQPTSGNVQFLVQGTGGLFAGTTAIGAVLDTNPHHVVGVWDSQTMMVYVDGVLGNSSNFPSVANIVGNTSDNLYISDGGSSDSIVAVQEAAFYETALSASRVAAHAYAALTAGYPVQDAGTRAAAIATNPLWSTAGIAAGGLMLEPRMWNGQSKLDEITTIVQAEKPSGLFYFDGSGNPQYLAWGDAQEGAVDAVFGDQSPEVPYDDITLIYDDEQYNRATVSTDSGVIHRVDDVTSQPPVLAYDDSSRILAQESDAQLAAQTVIDRYASPLYRVDQIALNGSRPQARAHILNRRIGDTIEVRRRGEGGTPIDIITRILGRQITIDVNQDLRCTYQLGHGFKSDGYWHLGVDGFCELGVNTVLG